jgi:CheY-like chemotaxis protein
MADVELKILLGAAIKNGRSQLGISQEELAYRAGLHRTYISDLERGARNPSLESVQKLARALDFSLPMLFERATNSNGSKQMVEILLVEDDPNDINLTVRAFETAKLINPVHVARDGVEALDFLFATGRYAGRKGTFYSQVVLLDLNLPKKSGIDVLRAIKADERTKGIPVVILTASRRDRDIAECRRLGAANYIVKPVGFQNFSELAPYLSMAWTLIKPLQTEARAA